MEPSELFSHSRKEVLDHRRETRKQEEQAATADVPPKPEDGTVKAATANEPPEPEDGTVRESAHRHSAPYLPTQLTMLPELSMPPVCVRRPARE